MTRLVIFDLDGTLLNTYADIAAATNHALALHGYPTHSVKTIRSYIGNGINKLFERALPEGHKSMDEVLAIRADFVPYYNEHGTEQTTPFPGAGETLAAICRKGVKVAVASNKYDQASQHLMRHFFPAIPFAAVLGQREGVPTKPDPTIVGELMARAGVERTEDVLYVGDSEVDMQTANNAHVRAIGVSWGCRTAEQLSRHSPEAVIDSFDQLLKHL